MRTTIVIALALVCGLALNQPARAADTTPAEVSTAAITTTHDLVQNDLIADAPFAGLETIAVDQPIRLNFSGMQNDPAPVLATDGDAWRVDLTLFIWAMGIDGDIGVGAQTAAVDASFLDVLDASDSLIGIAGRLEVGKGRWAGFVDGLYNKIGVKDATGPLGLADVDVMFKQGIVDFGVLYRLADWPMEQSGNSSFNDLTLDVYAGARYTTLSLELEPALLATVEREKDWIDPIVGARVTLPLSEHFHLTAWGDIGGFGVSSDFTWSAAALLGYNFTLFDHPAAVYAGYRALSQDYSDGSGANRFDWDVILHGPLLGFSMFF